MENSKRPEAAVAGQATTVPCSDSAAPTVYIVDPDEAARDSLEKLFRGIDCRVQSFAAAEEFLDSYRGRGTGCLVLEMDLPGVSGLDLQAMLSRRRIPLPVIALSGQGDILTAVRAIHAGAVDFIEKPYLPQVLVRRVREAIQYLREPSATIHERRAPS